MNESKKHVIGSKPQIVFTFDETAKRVISLENETELENKADVVRSFMSDTKAGTAKENDESYATAQGLWKDYTTVLEKVKYSLLLNRKQYNLLTDIILTKIEYGVDNIFYAIELTEALNKMRETSKFNNDVDVVGFEVNATELTYVYHLLSQFKVKGLTNNAYIFSQILLRIGDVSKVFNYFDIENKSLSQEVQEWTKTLVDLEPHDEVVSDTQEA